MENIIREAHSGIRWLVVLMTLVAFVWMIRGLVQNRAYDAMTYRVGLIWSSLVGAQWLLGILLFLVLGQFDVGYQWEHATTMTLALAVAHVHIGLKKRPDAIRYRGVLASIVVVMILVYVGVARLPQGWAM